MKWVISIVVILMASLLKGMTGFGFALMAIPLLTFFFPMHALVPAMTLLNLLTSVYILSHIKLKIKGKYFVPMLLASFIGIPVGVFALSKFPESTLQLTTGVSIISVSIFFLLGNSRSLSVEQQNKPIVFAGFISGLMTSSMSIGGPPIALAMNRKGYSKEYFRKIFALISVINAVISTTLYIAKGFFPIFSLKFTLFVLPAILIGSKLGDVLSKRINQMQFKKMILYLNLFLGAFIVVRLLFNPVL